jgi:transposase
MKTLTTSHLPNDEIDAVFDALHAQVAQLKHQVDWFKRQLFGRKSEKQIVDNPDQANLFALPTQGDKDPVPKKQIKAHTRSGKQKNSQYVNDTGLRFTDEVPQTVIDVPCPELAGENADNYEVIGTKETYRLAQQIGSYHILVYRKKVLKNKLDSKITQPPAPENVLEGCYADVSLLAGLMVDKAVYHLPLHRQHQRMLDAGVTLSRSTLLSYVARGIELLRPIARAMLTNMLAGQHLAMDEVPHKVGRTPPSKPSISSNHARTMKQTYFWPIYGQDDEVYFTWSNNRSAAHAFEQLQGFNGTLLTDGYAAYSKTVSQLTTLGQQITHATCWAHARRMFEKAHDSAPKESAYALQLIRQLYQVEKRLRGSAATPQKITEWRLKYSKPIVDTFYKWCYEQRQRVDLLPKDPFNKALYYAHERQSELLVYLTHADVPIDTNHLERALRVIPMGRKNHLFCWTELGAEQLGILHSLTVTCRLHNINPYVYLVDVLQRVSHHPAKDVGRLPPREWKQRFSHAPLKSDVNHVNRL